MTRHTYVSFLKSALRIVAGAALICNVLALAGIFLVLAEFLGIIEELPGMYKGTDTGSSVSSDTTCCHDRRMGHGQHDETCLNR